jgi:hypothetical protein
MKQRHRLPPRLSDAMRFAWLTIFGSIAFSIQLYLFQDIPLYVLLVDPWNIWMLYLIPVILILPVRSPKALYFRSFSYDQRGLATLFDIRKALRGRYRLAGIRPPRQRTSTFMKHLAAISFSFRYASLRYMSLEGGNDDWLPRLWSTLRTARCVFINVSDITDWVSVEARLCIATSRQQKSSFYRRRINDE